MEITTCVSYLLNICPIYNSNSIIQNTTKPPIFRNAIGKINTDRIKNGSQISSKVGGFFRNKCDWFQNVELKVLGEILQSKRQSKIHTF